jgi:thiamine-monophosphate kinase
VLGAAPAGRALLRSAAKPGQRIFVTGKLGLHALARAEAMARRARLTRVPVPRLAAGRVLVRTPGIGAVIDLSDGFAADLAHVLRASRVGAVVELSALPVTASFGRRCRSLGIDPLRCAATGGEDYELLFTASPRAGSADQLARRLRLPVTQVGVITRTLRIEGLEALGAARGYRHF